MTARTPAHPPANPKHIESLEAIMRELVVCYEQILTFAKQRRDAIRAADTSMLGSVIRQENVLVQRVADVEKRRIDTVRHLATELGSTAKEQTTVSWIASHLGDAGAQLRILADHLRQTISKVSTLNAVTKDAAETLAKHMQGIVHSVAKDRSFVKTYSSQGSMAKPSAASAGLNAVA